MAHNGHYIKKVNHILNTATYTNKKDVAANKKRVAVNIKKVAANNIKVTHGKTSDMETSTQYSTRGA